jgi:hypothetical protein
MPTRAMIRKGSWRRHGKREQGRVEGQAAGRAAVVGALASVFLIPAVAGEETGRTAEAAEAWAVTAAKPPKK